MTFPSGSGSSGSCPGLHDEDLASIALVDQLAAVWAVLEMAALARGALRAAGNGSRTPHAFISCRTC
jgi:hypothetical protein